MDLSRLDTLADVEAARKAKVLMDSLEPYFDAMHDALVRGFEDCPLRDEEGLMLIKLQLNALKKLQLNIDSIITTGRLAEIEIGESHE